MPRKSPPLTETHPDLVKEWNAERNGQRKPEELTKWSKVSVWWRCLTCANEWKNQVSNRTHSNNGCPCCNIGRLHSDGRNSLEKRNPELASQWHPTKNGVLSPSQVTLYHNKKVWWLCNDSQCEHPHEWQTSPSARVSSNSNCPFCYGNHSFCPCDSIATTHPELASQLHPDEPIPASIHPTCS